MILKTFFLISFAIGALSQCTSDPCNPNQRRSPVEIRSNCEVTPGGTTFQRVGKDAFQLPGVITFSEFPSGSVNPTYTPNIYGGIPTQPTVTFEGYFVGQSLSNICGGAPTGCIVGTPTSPLTLDTTSPDTFITGDGSNPTSPVLSGTPRFNGPISILLSQGVQAMGFDGGYFNAIGGTVIRAFDENGQYLGQISNVGTGIEFLGIAVEGALIKGVQLSLIGAEPAGFAIDNLIFGEVVTPETCPPPTTIPPTPHPSLGFCNEVANGFNLLTDFNANLKTGDIQGRVCTGTNFKAGNGFSVADQLAPAPPCENNLVVQGNLEWTGGRLYSGNALVGGSITLGHPHILSHPTLNNCSVVNPHLGSECKDTFSNVKTIWGQACSFSSNGNMTLPVGWLFNVQLSNAPFKGIHVIDVQSSWLDWRIGAGTFASLSQLQPNEIVIFKVHGTSSPSGGSYEDLAPYQSRVFWSFCNANDFDLSFNYNSFRGHVLAPNARLTRISGVVNGNVVVKKVETVASLQINKISNCQLN